MLVMVAVVVTRGREDFLTCVLDGFDTWKRFGVTFQIAALHKRALLCPFLGAGGAMHDKKSWRKAYVT